MTSQQRRWILGGGLASGKSAVRQFLHETGIATIDADSIGHDVLARGGAAFADASDRWPETVVDGQIDRRALAEIVFNDHDELAALESMTHPHIFDTIKRRVEEIEQTVVVEMPVIADRIDTGWRWIVVDSRDDVKVQRAVARGMREEDARARLAAQPTRSAWLAVADSVIPNHGSLADLESAVARLAERL